MDKLTAMLTFSTVVELASFSRAADALGIPKARVSQRVSDLENALGVRLLHRTTRILSLTVDGMAYAERCKQILDDLQELEMRVSGSTGSPKGRLRVETHTSFGRWVLSSKLIEFRRLYPLIQVRLGAHHQTRNMIEEGIDCAIRGGFIEDSSLIAHRVAMNTAAGLYASPKYLERFNLTNDPTDLDRADLIGWFDPKSNAPWPWLLCSGASEFNLKRPPTLLFDDPESAVVAATMGAGITIALPFAVERLVRQRQLVPVLPTWQFNLNPVHIVYPASRQFSGRVRAFVDWAIEMMKNSAELQRSPLDLSMIIDEGRSI